MLGVCPKCVLRQLPLRCLLLSRGVVPHARRGRGAVYIALWIAVSLRLAAAAAPKDADVGALRWLPACSLRVTEIQTFSDTVNALVGVLATQADLIEKEKLRVRWGMGCSRRAVFAGRPVHLCGAPSAGDRPTQSRRARARNSQEAPEGTAGYHCREARGAGPVRARAQRAARCGRA